MRKRKPVKVEVEIIYLPFPSEEKRREAYRVHAKLFLRVKERMMRKINP